MVVCIIIIISGIIMLGVSVLVCVLFGYRISIVVVHHYDLHMFVKIIFGA